MVTAKFFQDPTYTNQQKTLKGREAVADAMLSSGLSPMQLPSQPGVAASPFSGIAKILQAKWGREDKEKVQDDREQLGEEYQQILGEDVQNYQELSQTDPQAAVLAAITSRHPMLQQLGMSQLGQSGKKDYSNYKNVPGIGLVDVARPGAPTVRGNVYGEPFQRGGDWYQRDAAGKEYKLDNAPNMTMVNKGPNAGLTNFWKNAGDEVGALGKTAQKAQETLIKVDRLKKANQNLHSNVPATIASFTANLAQAIGVPVDHEKLRNTETFNADITEIWVDMIQSSGGARGWTAEETKRIDTMLPQITHSPEARAMLIDMMQEKAVRQIQNYRTAAGAFAKGVQAGSPQEYMNVMQDIYLPLPDNKVPGMGSGEAPAPVKIRTYNPATGRIE